MIISIVDPPEILHRTSIMHIASSNSAEIHRARHEAFDDEVVPAHRALAIVQNLLLSRFGHNKVRIYEAGGGSLSYLPPDLLGRADITVVDIDGVQLQRNQYANSKIRGDIQVQQFPSASFDLIVCYNVIEHLDRPDKAIGNFFHALAPAGVAFIAAPNPHSLSGFVTRCSPHWFHVLFYRIVHGNKNAGQPGNPPFPTVYHPIVSPQALIEFCKRTGFRVLYFGDFESTHLDTLRQRHPSIAKIVIALVRALEIVSRKDLRRGDFHILLEKPAQ